MNGGTPSPPKAHLNVQIFGPWVKQVTADSNGTLDVELIAGRVLASHRNLFDRVKTNVAQIGWSLQGFVPGKFKQSNVVGLPLLFEKSSVASQAMWRLFERGLISDEYSDVKVLAVFSFPPNALHTNDPIRNLEDLKGVKIGSTGPPQPTTPELSRAATRGSVSAVSQPGSGCASSSLKAMTPPRQCRTPKLSARDLPGCASNKTRSA